LHRPPRTIVACPYHKRRSGQGIISCLKEMRTLRIVNMTASSAVCRNSWRIYVAMRTCSQKGSRINGFVMILEIRLFARLVILRRLSWESSAELCGDGKSWIEFNRREENGVFNGRSQTAVFAVTRSAQTTESKSSTESFCQHRRFRTFWGFI
jgi:hypothetical protein